MLSLPQNLSCLDITTNDLPFGIVDCVYSDPPWGTANLKYWRTQNNQRGHSVDWPAFLSRFFAIAAHHCPTGPWWVETGMRFIDDVIAASPRQCGEVVNCRYRAGSKWLPNILLRFGGTQPVTALSPSDRHGLRLVEWALSPLPPFSPVLDPCCGKGTTARACINLGLQFYGNELNPKRAEQTAAVLRKAEPVGVAK